jgi:hypothetical protein
MKTFVKIILALSLSVSQAASAIQPVEAGLQPVLEQVQRTQQEIYSLAEQFAAYQANQAGRQAL